MENTVERRAAVAEWLGKVRERLGYSALTSHQQQAILERNARMRIRYVYTLRAFCNLIGVTGGLQKSDPSTKRYMSEARPSFASGGAGKQNWGWLHQSRLCLAKPAY